MKCIFWRESGKQPRQIAKQSIDKIQLEISIAVTNKIKSHFFFGKTSAVWLL